VSIRIQVLRPHVLTAAQGRQRKKQLSKIVIPMLEKGEGIGRSATGESLAIAVEWCEENGRPYVIHGVPGAGYTLELLDPRDWRTAP
jgi:hypothetical protein